MGRFTAYALCHIPTAILTLLAVCREPGCGAAVLQSDMKVSQQGRSHSLQFTVRSRVQSPFSGALWVVDSSCLNPAGSHSRRWKSSPTYQTEGARGRQKSVLNTELASLAFLTGQNFKPLQVDIL